MLSLALPALLCAGFSPGASFFLLYENGDNAQGRIDSLTALGKLDSAKQCQDACVSKLGRDPTTGCTSFTYYHPGHPSNANECYGDTSGQWTPFYSDLGQPQIWGNVTSGQNEPAKYSTSCTSKADCSYNGACTDAGVCKCHPQWMGLHCGQLNLAPTKLGSGLKSSDADGFISSWGGSVLRGDDGTYHMWAAEMVNHCGIVVWMSNSRIRHAISTTGPHGPFKPADVAEGVWGHEPTAARAPTGEFVLFWTAKVGGDVPCSRKVCAHGDDGNSIIGTPDCLPDTQCTYRPTLSTYMAYAKDPAGPWSTPVLVPSPNGDRSDTNLAPIIRADGSLLGLGRPPYVWEASDWRDNSTYTVTERDATIQGEDPFLYVDAYDTTVLHGLSHAGGWDSSGGHAWSTDGGKTWSSHDDVRAYGSNFLDDAGGQHSLSRRERPHLVFDERGVPVALTNGVTDAWPCTHPEVCPKDYCYTSLQLLNQDA